MHPALNRCTPLPLAPGRTLANRVVVPAMASETGDSLGLATDETLAHYTRLATARPGLLFVEYTYVHRSGRSEPRQLGADDDAQIPGLAKIATVIRADGALPGLQLTHAGGKSSRDLTGGPLMGPSGIRVPVKDRELETPDAMADEDVTLWRDAFVAAAVRGAAAGFAVIELHAAHGYGLNQWLSPLTNHREDRLALVLEIVDRIRRRLPDVLLSVRIPGQDHLPGGLTPADALELARALRRHGVTFINVSSGLGGWRRPRDRVGEGYLVPEAAQIQAGLDAPVIGVGGIETAGYIDESLAAGRFTLAAVGRAILDDPAGWSRRHLTCGGSP